MNFIRRTTLVAIIIIAFSVNILAAEKHFHPKGKMPSKFTIEFQNGQRKSLPFDDRRDFEEAIKEQHLLWQRVKISSLQPSKFQK